MKLPAFLTCQTFSASVASKLSLYYSFIEEYIYQSSNTNYILIIESLYYYYISEIIVVASYMERLSKFLGEHRRNIHSGIHAAEH